MENKKKAKIGIEKPHESLQKVSRQFEMSMLPMEKWQFLVLFEVIHKLKIRNTRPLFPLTLRDEFSFEKAEIIPSPFASPAKRKHLKKTSYKQTRKQQHWRERMRHWH